jgi:hypothetical protein
VPAVRTSKKIGKPKAAPRTRPRVTDTEDTSGATVKSVAHRQTQSPVSAMAQSLNGDVLIVGQLSELVPVAQYANVTLGPNQIAWKLSGADMSILADVDWDSEDALSEEQQEVFDRVMGALKATSRLLEVHLSEDRETVDRSVRQHNEREASEAAEKKTPRSRSRR